MPRQRFQRPVRIRHHANMAFGPDEDGHVRTNLPAPRCRFGGVQDVAGLFGQMHTFISQSFARILIVNSLTAVPSNFRLERELTPIYQQLNDWLSTCSPGGMNLIANLSPTYRRSFSVNNLTGMTDAGDDSNRAYTEMMGILNGLSQHDPSLYQRVKQEIVSSLRTAKSFRRSS
jgi:hypothetical protein